MTTEPDPARAAVDYLRSLDGPLSERIPAVEAYQSRLWAAAAACEQLLGSWRAQEEVYASLAAGGRRTPAQDALRAYTAQASTPSVRRACLAVVFLFGPQSAGAIVHHVGSTKLGALRKNLSAQIYPMLCNAKKDGLLTVDEEGRYAFSNGEQRLAFGRSEGLLDALGTPRKRDENRPDGE